MKARTIFKHWIFARKIWLLLIVTCSHALGQTSTNYAFGREGISRDALERYLDHSITMAFFLVPRKPEGNRVYPYHDDDVRMINNYPNIIQ